MSKALYNLTARDPVVMAKQVLPTLLPLTTALDLNTRHGSILCVAELTHALFCCGVESNRLVYFDQLFQAWITLSTGQ